MKKHIIILTLLLCICCLCYSCSDSATSVTPSPAPALNTSPTPEASPAPNGTPKPVVTIHPEYGELPVYQPGSIRLDDRATDDFSFIRKYRTIYYNMWGHFTTRMLGEERTEEFEEWFFETIKESNYGKDQNEMLLVSLIKHFEVPREQFDKAAESYVKQRIIDGWDLLYEEYEVPNGDIIYTFDNEIINEYYRYE